MQEPQGELLRKIRENEARIQRIEKDLWFGNGKRGLTTRMQQVEDKLDDMKHSMTEYNRNAFQMKLLLIGAIVSAIAAAVISKIHF